MPIQQHYYTSFVNKANGRSGFQTRAMSPGILAADQAQLLRMLAYRLPAGLDASAVAQHPVALRYFYQDEETSFLIHSQSTGNDDNGRPGNFFAHSLIIPPELFSNIPPVFFWRSSFWKAQDNTATDELPLLSDLEMEPALDTEQIWSLLHSEQNRQYLAALISAVLHLERSQRSIILIGTSDQIALWIATVSCMLPPACRPLLSFTTYQHHPYQSQFMLTGVPAQIPFQPGTNDYRHYFILNLISGKISHSEPSAYARLISTIASEKLYEEQLLPLFEAHTANHPTPSHIDTQLDSLVQNT
ncbi:GAP1-N2 domain-containing protein [Dictyobacter kobayashii]|uniref:Uncharacterized protein n=1 Tax=Dictyobacter kobayashii TaxID=2014872 RepID=A0A402AV08_9CHLR|nr:hypothetical protein [Dictyobacter kobayashii]GCE22970.1 hypothetical protein KDK_67700 [Dictyobacter kobayashii]